MTELRNYISLNLRGKTMMFGKDIVCELPYIASLVSGPLQNSERDEHGVHIIDEQDTTFCMVLDRYREWLQLESPEYFDNQYISRRGLLVACAQRLGCEYKFVEALRCRRVVEHSIDDLYRCYYCNQVFSHTERDSQKECKYHSIGCNCKSYKYGCTRLPYHSETRLDIANEPNPV